MYTFNYFYAVTILQLALRHSDNLSKTLQKSFLTSYQEKEMADLTMQTINSIRKWIWITLAENCTTNRGF